VLSGHTHAAYNCRLPNAKGRAVPVSSANALGRVLSDIDLRIDPATRDVVEVQVTNRLVDRSDPTVTPDAGLAGIVRGYDALVAPRAAVVIGSIAAELPNNARDPACNMPAGELIADAQLAATTAPAFGGAAIAFMNRGGVRTPGFTYRQRADEGDGNVTYGEAFTTQPFGNSLVTVTLTAQDIKDVLEQQFAGCRGQLPTATRLMIPSAGFKYRWDGAKACEQRVHSVTLTRDGRTETLVDAGGKVPDPTREYRVTVNSFMASGGDSFGTFVKGKAPLGGALDIDALVDYMTRFKAPNPPYAPGARAEDGGTARIGRTGGTACPTGADTNP
jgi:5'-nucleotidase